MPQLGFMRYPVKLVTGHAIHTVAWCFRSASVARGEPFQANLKGVRDYCVRCPGERQSWSGLRGSVRTPFDRDEYAIRLPFCVVFICLERFAHW